MEGQSIYAVIITIITVLGSAGAWKYYERRLRLKKRDGDFLRDNYTERIDKLEVMLKESSKEKDALRDKVLDLTKELAEISVRVKFLQEENKRVLEFNAELNRIIAKLKNIESSVDDNDDKDSN